MLTEAMSVGFLRCWGGGGPWMRVVALPGGVEAGVADPVGPVDGEETRVL